MGAEFARYLVETFGAFELAHFGAEDWVKDFEALGYTAYGFVVLLDLDEAAGEEFLLIGGLDLLDRVKGFFDFC